MNIVSKFIGRVVHHFVPLEKALERWGAVEGVFIWTEMVNELKKLSDNGVWVIEASDIREWYFDPKLRRCHYLAPHWFASSE